MSGWCGRGNFGRRQIRQMHPQQSSTLEIVQHSRMSKLTTLLEFFSVISQHDDNRFVELVAPLKVIKQSADLFVDEMAGVTITIAHPLHVGGRTQNMLRVLAQGSWFKNL